VVFSASALRAAPPPPPSELIKSMVEVVGQALAEHRQSPKGIAQAAARQGNNPAPPTAAPHVITTQQHASTFMQVAANELLESATAAVPVTPKTERA
jgi:hypothetical protein